MRFPSTSTLARAITTAACTLLLLTIRILRALSGIYVVIFAMLTVMVPFFGFVIGTTGERYRLRDALELFAPLLAGTFIAFAVFKALGKLFVWLHLKMYGKPHPAIGVRRGAL
jgi:hypothetical protein